MGERIMGFSGTRFLYKVEAKEICTHTCITYVFILYRKKQKSGYDLLC